MAERPSGFIRMNSGVYHTTRFCMSSASTFSVRLDNFPWLRLCARCEYRDSQGFKHPNEIRPTVANAPDSART